jgi:hypothetical protein
MIYKCTRADQREDGRFHYEFEGPTILEPPRPTPRLQLLHPVELPFTVGGLYEHAAYPVQLTRADDAPDLVASPEGHALPLVSLAAAGTVTPPPEG